MLRGERGEVLFQDYLNVPFDALFESGGMWVRGIKGLLSLLGSQLRRRNLPVRHYFISHVCTVLDLDVDCLSVVRHKTKTTNLTNRLVLLWIREEALVELISSPIALLIITQMLCESNFENQGHEILHLLPPLIEVFLGERVPHHQKGQIRLHCWNRFVLELLQRRQLPLILLAPLLKYV